MSVDRPCQSGCWIFACKLRPGALECESLVWRFKCGQVFMMLFVQGWVVGFLPWFCLTGSANRVYLSRIYACECWFIHLVFNLSKVIVARRNVTLGSLGNAIIRVSTAISNYFDSCIWLCSQFFTVVGAILASGLFCLPRFFIDKRLTNKHSRRHWFVHAFCSLSEKAFQR